MFYLPCVMKISRCATICLLTLIEIYKLSHISQKISVCVLVAVCLSIRKGKLSCQELLKKGHRVPCSRGVPPCVIKITLCVAVCLIRIFSKNRCVRCVPLRWTLARNKVIPIGGHTSICTVVC